MKVINLYGGPGSGKSTGAAYVFARLKMAGVNCELVNEFAKQLVWEDRQKAFTDQFYIFAKQHHRLHIINGEVDVAIVDSPLLLNILYGRVNNNCPECFYELVRHANSKFDNLNFFIDRVKSYNPVGRQQGEAEANILAIQLERMLANVPLHFVEGNHQGYDHIFNIIMEELK